MLLFVLLKRLCGDDEKAEILHNDQGGFTTPGDLYVTLITYVIFH